MPEDRHHPVQPDVDSMEIPFQHIGLLEIHAASDGDLPEVRQIVINGIQLLNVLSDAVDL